MSKSKTTKPGSQQQVVVLRLRKIIDELRWLIIEHHSYTVMSREHWICPKCTMKKYDKLLNRAAKAGAQHNDKLTDGEQPPVTPKLKPN